MRFTLKNTVSVLCLAAVSIIVSACAGYASWSTYGANPARTFSIEEDIAPPLELAWKQPKSLYSDWQTIFIGPPVYGFGMIFVPAGGHIAAYSSTDGALVWGRAINNQICQHCVPEKLSLTSDGHLLTYLYTTSHQKQSDDYTQRDLIALDIRKRGEETWRLENIPFPPGGSYKYEIGGPIALGNRIYMVLNDGSINIFDSESGKGLWRNSSIRFEGFAAGLINKATSDDKLPGISSSLDRVYLQGGEWLGCLSLPQTVGNEIYRDFYWDYVKSVNPINYLRPPFHAERQYLASPVFGEESLYGFRRGPVECMTDFDPEQAIYAFDFDGNLRWLRTIVELYGKEKPYQTFGSNLAYSHDKLFFCSAEGQTVESQTFYIFALDTKTGKVLWENKGFWAHTLVVLGNYLYAQNADEVRIYDARNGKFLAKSQAMGGSYLVSDGKLVYTIRIIGRMYDPVVELSAWNPAK